MVEAAGVVLEGEGEEEGEVEVAGQEEEGVSEDLTSALALMAALPMPPQAGNNLKPISSRPSCKTLGLTSPSTNSSVPPLA
ncbi:hypothetical protein JCM11641_008216 [Rhodosporidiobolus odoratus]